MVTDQMIGGSDYQNCTHSLNSFYGSVGGYLGMHYQERVECNSDVVATVLSNCSWFHRGFFYLGGRMEKILATFLRKLAQRMHVDLNRCM